MGTFFTEAQLAAPTRPDRREAVKLLVDSGSMYTWVSGSSLRDLHTLCLFGEPGDLEVLGAYTLEGFGLGIDPVQRRLIPAILYGA